MNTDLLERELRLHEDALYELEDHLDDCHAMLKGYRRENLVLRKRLGLKPNEAIGEDDTPRDDAMAASKSGRDDESPLQAPQVEGYDDDLQDGDLPQLPTSIETDVLEPVPEELPGPTAENRAAVIGDDLHNLPLMIKALVPPRRRGDLQPRIRLAVEPRDDEGRLVTFPGELSVMLRDSSQRKVRRWDFKPDETRQFWGRSTLGRGFHLNLPWPKEAPPGEYELWVRMKNVDGRKHIGGVLLDVDAALFAAADRPQANGQAAAPGPLPTSAGAAGSSAPGTDAPPWPTRQPDVATAPPPTESSESPAVAADSRDRAPLADRAPEDRNRSVRRRPTWSPSR